MKDVKPRQSCMRLVAFIIIVAGLYLLFLQLAELVVRYRNKEKKISFDVSEEDASIPGLIVCITTDDHLRQSALDKYNLKSLLLGSDSLVERDMIKENWKDFPWEDFDIQQVYEEAVIYPMTELVSCTIGEHYSCADAEGDLHKWVNQLSNTESCSILTTSLKVAYQHTINVQLDFKPELLSYNPYIKRQHRKSRYSNYYQNYWKRVPKSPEGSQSVMTVKVTQQNFLSNEEGHKCSEEDTLIECKEECVAKYLMEEDFACVLPWMTASGSMCRNLTAAQKMVERENKMVKLDCDCIHPCMYYEYSEAKSFSNTKSSFYGVTLILDNTKGVVSFHEDYLYYFLDLLANCGGCISVFGTFSLLWIITKLIEAVFNITKRETVKRLVRWETPSIHKYFLWLAAASCYIVFLYQAYWVVTEFAKGSVTLTVERLRPEEAPLPALLLCNSDINVEYLKRVMEYQHFILRSNYMEKLYERPRLHMTKCLLDEESCMQDNGTKFYWKALYYIEANCDAMFFHEDKHVKPRMFSAEFESEFTDVAKEDMLLTLVDKNAITNYEIFDMSDFLHIGRNFRNKITYDMKLQSSLPPCIDNYQKCVDACWETEFLKENICTPPLMPASVRYKPCPNIEELTKLSNFLQYNTYGTDSCNCPKPCTIMELEFTTGADRGESSESQTEVKVELLPLSYTKSNENWSFTANAFVAEIGGIFGIVTGSSFLEIAFVIFSLIIKLKKRISSRFNTLTSHGKTLLYLTAYGVFFHQAYTIVTYFGQKTVHIIEGEDFSSYIDLPDIIVCPNVPRLFSSDDKETLLVLQPPRAQAVVEVEPDSDIFSYWNFFDYPRLKNIRTCRIFGSSCLNDSGQLFEWKPAPRVNGYCWRLHIYAVNMGKYLSNEIVFSFSSSFRFYLSNEEETAVEVWNLHNKYEFETILYRSIFLLYRSRYELLEDKPGNCINEAKYTKDKCLNECLDKHLVNTYGCYFPWMNNITGLDVCRNATDYMYRNQLEASTLASCNCMPPCHYKEYNLKLYYSESSSRYEGEIVLIVQDTERVIKEVWAYTFSKLLAELGGLMSLFTGLTLYDIVFSDLSFLKRIIRN